MRRLTKKDMSKLLKISTNQLDFAIMAGIIVAPQVQPGFGRATWDLDQLPDIVRAWDHKPVQKCSNKNCNQPARPGYKRCETCYRNSKKVYERRAAAHICYRCASSDVKFGTKYCQKCLNYCAKDREYRRAIKDKKHLCLDCSLPALENKRYCQAHLDRYKTNSKNRIKK